jgi:hypothetical protein
MDTSSLPGTSTVTFSDTGDNSLEIGSFYPADVGVYTLDYWVDIGGYY